MAVVVVMPPWRWWGNNGGSRVDVRLRVVRRGVVVVEVDGGGSARVRGVGVLQPIVLAHRGACQW